MVFDLNAVVSDFSVKHAHNLIGYFSDGSYFYVACVCNHCHRTNQNCRSMMVLTILLSCAYDTFSSYHISFSSMTSLTMMVIGPGHPVRTVSHFPLKILLVA